MPLLIHLSHHQFETFRLRRKHIQYQELSEIWNEDTCQPGQEIIVALGYSYKQRLKGFIVNTWTSHHIKNTGDRHPQDIIAVCTPISDRPGDDNSIELLAVEIVPVENTFIAQCKNQSIAKKWLYYLKQYKLLGKAQLVRNNTSIAITNLTSTKLQQLCSVINWKAEPHTERIQQLQEFVGIIKSVQLTIPGLDKF
jgi:hypothetical protein